ncbi:MAG: hypothetical protein K6E42_00500 [Synergistes sp.]|nr:hypothetical protein [Synergistes sp.]
MGYDTTDLKEFTKDYISRTEKNYDKILEIYCKDNKKKSENVKPEVFEVTQLINSLLGILVMSFESVKALKKNQMNPNEMRDINKKMKSANENAFNELSNVIDELKKNNKFYDSYSNDHEKDISEIAFVRRLRNSLSHSGNKGLRFFPIEEKDQDVNKIKSIIFCDEEKNKNEDAFIAELSVEQVARVFKSLKLIFGNFEDFAEYYDLSDYQKDINTMRTKMENVYKGVFTCKKKDLELAQKKFKGNLEKIEKDELYICSTIVYDELDFFTWIFQSCGIYRLIGPEAACEKMKQMIQKIVI